VNGVLDWLAAQAHVMTTVLGAVISDQPAPARQVVIYTAVLAALAYVVPKIVKAVSK
jgi:hypothetical protein